VPGGDANGFSTGMMYDSMPMGSWAENPISDTLKKFFDVPSYEKVGRLCCNHLYLRCNSPLIAL